MNKAIRHIQLYREKIFAGDDPRQILKWTVSSDLSTIFFDVVHVVRKDDDSKAKLNWLLKFPQSFLISNLAGPVI